MSRASEWAMVRTVAERQWGEALANRPEWSTWGLSITTEDDGRPSVVAKDRVTLDPAKLCEAARFILDTFGEVSA